MMVIKTAPEAAILLVVLAVALVWRLSRFYYKNRLDDKDRRLKLRDDQIGVLKDANEKLERNNDRLQSQLKAQTPATSSSVFEIKPLKWGILWRKKGETGHHPLLPSQIVPDDATLVLQVETRIRAMPERVVEDVVLFIAGNRLPLPLNYWQPRSVDHCEQYFYFDIPSYIQLAHHKVQLIAECEGGIEEKSVVFRVPLTRTYMEGL